ncbi:unnamed protein product, partial [Ilex paraguariensis]
GTSLDDTLTLGKRNPQLIFILHPGSNEMPLHHVHGGRAEIKQPSVNSISPVPTIYAAYAHPFRSSLEKPFQQLHQVPPQICLEDIT